MSGSGPIPSTSTSYDWPSNDQTVEGQYLDTTAIGLPPFLSAVVGELVAILFIILVFRAPKGNEAVQKVQKSIQVGAMTFIKYEYAVLYIVAACLLILICLAVHWKTGICYICGVIASSLCGFLGMWICTSANGRTAAAAEQGLNAALRVAFNAGSVMGLSVVCVGLGTISALLMIFEDDAIAGRGALAGFGMGASTVAIIARVGGGIYTKAADVGADLVGKVEKNLPEDDPRNPATIADNVGDNVGDVCGMGADLFSSFVGSIVASALLGYQQYGPVGMAFPYWISMGGIFASIIGIMTVRCKEDATQGDLLFVLRNAQLLAGLLQAGFIAVVTYVLDVPWEVFGCCVIGLVAGVCLGILSEYFTSYAHYPTKMVAKTSRIGAANVIIGGLAVGMYATVMPTAIIASVIIACKSLSGSYGVALASTGLLSTLGITLSTDAYGPVADNAGGIAEMCGMPAHTRKNTDVLDALGNTTAAIGKGFAVGSAVLTAISLLNTYCTRVGIFEAGTPLDVGAIGDQRFVAGVLLGAMLPYFFGAMTMQAVNIAAQSVVVEVRRQFPMIESGAAEPDYAACVAMISRGALHAMVFPCLLVVIAPIVIGLGLGPRMLAGLLIGAITTGFMLGILMGTAGGSWDNAKKYIESGHYGGKRTSAHKAAVVGDTVGDPFKDTSGPAINIQIKLMSYISVVLVPVFKEQRHLDYWWGAIIIFGVIVFFFAPFWTIVMTPDALRTENIDKVIEQLAAANEEANNAGANPNHAKTDEEGKDQSFEAVQMHVINKK